MEFWVSCVIYNDFKRGYVIYNVMLLDEDVEVVNNLVYINMIVKLNLEFVYEVFLNVFENWKIIV